MKKVLLSLLAVCFSVTMFAQTTLEMQGQAAQDVYSGYNITQTPMSQQHLVDYDPQVNYSNPGDNPMPSKALSSPVGSGVVATILMGLGYVFVRSRRKE